jgi:hypothetical protein
MSPPGGQLAMPRTDNTPATTTKNHPIAAAAVLIIHFISLRGKTEASQIVDRNKMGFASTPLFSVQALTNT